MSVDGGAPVPLVETGIFAGANWLDGGDVVFGSGLDRGVMRIPAAGGAAAALAELADGELFHATPQMLPGENSLLVTVYGTPPSIDGAVIAAVSLADRSRKTIARGGTSARYVPSGHLVYTNRNTMSAVPFDPVRLEARGTAVPVLSDMAYDVASGLAQFDISRDGTMVYRTGTARSVGVSTMQWMDASGGRQALPARPGERIGPPRLSPDGKRIAMVVKEGTGQDVWVYDIERDAATRLTFGEASFVSPTWSVDGRFVVFGSIGNGISWARADGGGRPQMLVANKTVAFPVSFTPDGKRLAYYQVVGTPQISTVAIESGDGLAAAKPEAFLATPSVDVNPKFSPDGRWLAYESNETGRTEVFVRAFPVPSSGQGGKWQISNSGGNWPIWSPNRREILYRSGDQVMSVDYTVTGDAFVPGRPRVWLSAQRGAVVRSCARWPATDPVRTSGRAERAKSGTHSRVPAEFFRRTAPARSCWQLAPQAAPLKLPRRWRRASRPPVSRRPTCACSSRRRRRATIGSFGSAG